ncbi:hypothetical protein [Thermosinus carboxydivorans]|uniref:hypothetical protein n=1 Tax=Thermosinus carboxydivorans TaxID=261685 RepID=UPI0002D624D1|nr:hypothetical protein [Thermosinus carboxydivorans]
MMHRMIEDNLCVRLEALVRDVLWSPSRKLNIRRRLSVFMLCGANYWHEYLCGFKFV